MVFIREFLKIRKEFNRLTFLFKRLWGTASRTFNPLSFRNKKNAGLCEQVGPNAHPAISSKEPRILDLYAQFFTVAKEIGYAQEV
jgi:hypothetical protein